MRIHKAKYTYWENIRVAKILRSLKCAYVTCMCTTHNYFSDLIFANDRKFHNLTDPNIFHAVYGTCMLNELNVHV